MENEMEAFVRTPLRDPNMEPPQYEHIIRLGKLGDYSGVPCFGSLRRSGFLRPGTYMKSVPGGSASDLEEPSANALFAAATWKAFSVDGGETVGACRF